MAARTIEDGDRELQRRIAALRNSPVSLGVSIEQRWVVTKPKQDRLTKEWRSEVVATFCTEQEAERAAREMMRPEEDE